MAEIKHNFAGGKMNKDVDERLVPNGQYTDALNVQVSTGESSSIGTIQNLHGNSLVPYQVVDFITTGSTCIGAIADEKNDAVYSFIKGPISPPNQFSSSWDAITVKDMIVEKKPGLDPEAVVVDFRSTLVQCYDPDSSTGVLVLEGINGFNAVNVGDIITAFKSVFTGDNVPGTGSYAIASKDAATNSVVLSIISGVWPQNQGGGAGLYFEILNEQKPLNFPRGDVKYGDEILINGMNIIDDMLFWTDGVNEPKKINISRSKVGTIGDGSAHTRMINLEDGISFSSNILLEEKHVTVIKRSPKTPLFLEKIPQNIFGYGISSNSTEFWANDNFGSSGGLMPVGGGLIKLNIILDINSPIIVDTGDILVLNPVSATVLPPYDYIVEVKMEYQLGTSPLPSTTQYYTSWMCSIISMSDLTPLDEQGYNWSTKVNFDYSFKNKFPRFSYRYKYEDGEYSSYAPFTAVAFDPGDFRYDVKDAYNTGMENTIKKLILKDYKTNIPKDVNQIDILYKESNSPVIYMVDSAYPDTGNEQYWDDKVGYEVNPTSLKAAMPENQMLRPWDAVPKNALAQEISGNRIIYANYEQNYDLKGTYLFAKKQARSLCDFNPGYKSLKSIRNYNIGISYLDKYGRETPVFSHKDSSFEIPIRNSNHQNQIYAQANPTDDTKEWAKYYKIYIKEISNEYYNLAQDRVYDADDGNVWLSFPSSERNKVDEESYLILKKGVAEDDDVNESNRYKVLAIENEAPEFIKTRIQYSAKSDTLPSVTFQAGGLPLPTYQKIIIKKDTWSGNEMPLSDLLGQAPEYATLAVRFETLVAGTISQQTKLYNVIDFFDTDPSDQADGTYSLKLDKVIDETWLEEDLTGTATPGVMNPSTKILVYKKIIESRPEFDGRFFVKVANDLILNTHITSQAATFLTQVQVTGQSMPFYYVSDNDHPEVGTGTSGFNKTDSSSDWETVLKFGTGSRKNRWFIDQARYSGKYTGSQLQTYGMYHLSDVQTTCDGYPSSTRANGWNDGIYEDSNGQCWIDLSFGNLKNADANAWSNSLFPAWSQATSAQKDARWQDVIDWTRSNGGSYHEIGCTTGSYPCGDRRHWQVGSAYNTNHADQMWFVQKLVQGTEFKFGGDPNATVYTITADPVVEYYVNYSDIASPQGIECTTMDNQFNNGSSYWSGSMAVNDAEDYFNAQHHLGHPRNRRITYKIPINANPRLNTFDPLNATTGANLSTAGAIQFLEDSWIAGDGDLITEYPAIWETEPKEDVDLDIYYEMDGAFPLSIDDDTNEIFAPIGTIIKQRSSPIVAVNSSHYFITPTSTVEVIGWNDNIVEVSEELNDAWADQDMLLAFHRPDGSCVVGRYNGGVNGYDNQGLNFFSEMRIKRDVSSEPIMLSYFNCYAFGNGVESNRVRDDFNQVMIEKGVKASTSIQEEYKVEHRKNSLIYSGVYNSTSGINNLNQFIAAEKITKELNPTYGSIQKLHSRDSDLIALCEDKVLKILANKDAVFNADGNPQLVSTSNVLGQTIPFGGEYGISTNPESFASESYRAYFTDKTRGAVMRLSKDGLTPISDHGMKDWFRDNLKIATRITGSYDDYKQEYNVTLHKNLLFNLNNPADNETVTFREDVKGWVSFKSFIPEYGISCASSYYTFKSGKMWLHHDESVDANDFYGLPYNSSFTVSLNDMPGSVKSYKSLNYEGTQSRVIPFTTDIITGLTDGEYYNLASKDGWYVDSITTDKESGLIDEFIEKEGKWFNYIKGKDITHNAYNIEINADGSSSFDQASFAIQGLGILKVGPINVNIYGCMDSTAYNYNSQANTDDGSCQPFLYGCLEGSASNYSVGLFNTDDGSCIWYGCLDNTCQATNSGWSGWSSVGFPVEANAYNTTYGGGSIQSDNSCIAAIYGCTNPDPNVVMNYNANANVNQVSCADTSDPCVYVSLGCVEPSADNYNSIANTENGTCTWYGCTDTPSPTYGQTSLAGNIFPAIAFTYASINPSIYGIQDDGSCVGEGCMDPTANNYDPAAVYDLYPGTDASCIFCNWDATGTNSYNGIPITTDYQDATGSGANNGQIAVVTNPSGPYMPYTYIITDSSGLVTTTYVNNSWLNSAYQTDSILFNNLAPETYTVQITGNDMSSASYCYYSVTVTVGTGVTPSYGCTDSYACNYDFPADATHIDDGSCDWTTCAGCIDPLANYPNAMWAFGTSYQSQTGNPFTDTAQCILPGTVTPGPCTIACGDGNSGASYGSYCCGYQAFGCTDANAINYYGPAGYNTDLVDDGSCDYTGCTDPTANNYDAAATIDDGSCTYTPISGCTDPNACNYDSNASIDDNSCLLGFVSAQLGDPTSGLPEPHYYYDGAIDNAGDVAKHFAFGYPLTSVNELDIGLSIQSEDPTLAQYDTSNGDAIMFQVRESATNSAPFSTITRGPESITAFGPTVWNHQSSGAIYGDRTGSYVGPYPFGPAMNASNNEEFGTYFWNNGWALKKYKIEVWSVVDGVEYGKHDGSSPGCGVYTEFVFTPLNLCNNQFAISGCTDISACNYQASATCDDGSCYYGTVGGFDCVNSGPPNFTNNCVAVSCGTPQFPNLNACLTGGCGSN
tara:strand:- start:175 stop:7914 length:7740 start_codon:yes stop_codon:yes gene_type:complete